MAVPSLNRIYHGDALSVLSAWPEELVDCIVTSPPYYRQRDYAGQAEQVGMEETPQDYVRRLVAIFGQCRRVLKESGSLWLVIGDKYDGGEQLGLPWRVALALMDDGWILRSDCIWHKPNAMPSHPKKPAHDRPRIHLLLHQEQVVSLRRRCHSRAARHLQRKQPHEGARPLRRRGARRRSAKTAARATCTTAAGIRPFIRWDATSGPSGRFPSPSSAEPTSPSSRNLWSAPAFSPPVPKGASSSTPSSAAARRPSSPKSLAANTWASTAPRNTGARQGAARRSEWAAAEEVGSRT